MVHGLFLKYSVYRDIFCLYHFIYFKFTALVKEMNFVCLMLF